MKGEKRQKTGRKHQAWQSQPRCLSCTPSQLHRTFNLCLQLRHQITVVSRHSLARPRPFLYMMLKFKLKVLDAATEVAHRRPGFTTDRQGRRRQGQERQEDEEEEERRMGVQTKGRG